MRITLFTRHDALMSVFVVTGLVICYDVYRPPFLCVYKINVLVVMGTLVAWCRLWITDPSNGLTDQQEHQQGGVSQPKWTKDEGRQR